MLHSGCDFAFPSFVAVASHIALQKSFCESHFTPVPHHEFHLTVGCSKAGQRSLQVTVCLFLLMLLAFSSLRVCVCVCVCVCTCVCMCSVKALVADHH